MPRRSATLPLLAFIGVCLAVVLLTRAPRSQPASQAAPNSSSPAQEKAGDAPLQAKLSIDSQPSGASLMINGRLAGSTPLQLDSLPVGEYGLRLEKDGCSPVSLKVELGRDGAHVSQKLEALPTGSLSVEVKPEGSDVLLDGELIGQTPLKIDRLPVGTYDLLIRRTNYNAYASRVEIQAGQRAQYSGIELTDRVLSMLEGLEKAEPQRLSHYIDLAHYYFVNNNLDRAVDTFTQALEKMHTPLNFDGPGYPGKDNMGDEEREQEERMRKRDEERLLKELEKHKNWPARDTKEFRRRIEQAQELINIKNLPSWEWAERTARMYITQGNYDKAQHVYEEHIKVAKDGPDLPKAYLALMDVDLLKRDLKSTSEVFETFFFMNSSNAEALRSCGEMFVNKHLERIVSSADRQKLVELAEKSLRRGVEITNEPKAKAQSQTDLGMALLNLGRPADAVEQFQSALALTEDPVLQEDRALNLAGALRRAGKLNDARSVCEKLKDSPRAPTRERVKIELLTINNAERKK